VYDLGLNSGSPGSPDLIIEVPLIAECERITPLNSIDLDGAGPVVCCYFVQLVNITYHTHLLSLMLSNEVCIVYQDNYQ
jgi:hypothetical protein